VDLGVSQVIASYLADKYQDHGASLALDTAEDRAHDHLVQRVHDLYITTVQAGTSCSRPQPLPHACP
jgi:hypothetical protein